MSENEHVAAIYRAVKRFQQEYPISASIVLDQADALGRDLAEAEARAGWVPVNDEEAMESIGTAIHTGLRKGTDAPEAHALWTAIRDSESAWSDAVAYAVVTLREYGYGTLCKPGDLPDAAGEES